MQEDNTERAGVWFKSDGDDYWTEIGSTICSAVTEVSGTIELPQRERDRFQRFLKKVFQASQDSGPFSKFIRMPAKPYTYPKSKRRT